MKDYRKNGKKNVTLLGITSFLNDLSSEMIMPVLPFFLSALGASPVLIGLVGGLRNSLDKILKVFFGYLSDKVGSRKNFIYGGYFTSALFKIALAFSPTAGVAASTASLERVGKGMRDAPRDAMIGKFMPDKTGEGFGIHQMLDTAGAVCGALSALILLMFFSLEYSSIILIGGTLALLSLIPLFFVMKTPGQTDGLKDMLSSLSEIPGHLWIFNLVAGLFSVSAVSYMFFLMKAELSEGIIIPIGLYALYNVFYAGGSYPLGKKADEIGKKKILFAGYILFSISCLLFAIFSGIYILLLIFVLYGISKAAVNMQRAYVVDSAPSRIKATSVGAFQLVVGISAVISGLIAGVLWEHVSPEATFFFGSALSFLAAILLAWKVR
jgi:MFS family permease